MKSVAVVCLFGVFCAVSGMILKELNPKFSAVFSLGSGVVFLLLAWRYLSPVAEYAKTLAGGESDEALGTLPKALGMAILVGITADLCRDMGERAAAEKVELCGKAALALMALPLLKEIFSLLREML